MGALRRATAIGALMLHTTSATILSSFDEAKLLRVDAILVLGGGAPPAPDAQLPFVAARCKAAAALWKAAAKKPKILTLSAGTAHVPQLLDARGSVVFEATASAAVIINEGVDAADVFVETTSFDTIGNALYSVWKSTIELGFREAPRHRADAATETTSCRWRGAPEI